MAGRRKSCNLDRYSGLEWATKYYFSVPFAMSQASQLVDLVKQTLRDRGRTYSDLAHGLGLSESSVKRLFSQKKLTLDRLEEICKHLDLEISDLLEIARTNELRITELTEEQERSLVANQRLLLVGLLALSHWTAAEIVTVYRLT